MSAAHRSQRQWQSTSLSHSLRKETIITLQTRGSRKSVSQHTWTSKHKWVEAAAIPLQQLSKLVRRPPRKLQLAVFWLRSWVHHLRSRPTDNTITIPHHTAAGIQLQPCNHLLEVHDRLYEEEVHRHPDAPRFPEQRQPPDAVGQRDVQPSEPHAHNEVQRISDPRNHPSSFH